VTGTGEHATREGYDCVKYEVTKGGVKVRELWVTDWSNVSGQGDIAAAMTSMMGFLDQLTSVFSRFGGNSIGSSVAQWRGVDGMPIVTTEFEGGRAVKERVVRSIEASTIDPATFEAPSDYTQKTIGG
jgi:hypothetical protein